RRATGAHRPIDQPAMPGRAIVDHRSAVAMFDQGQPGPMTRLRGEGKPKDGLWIARPARASGRPSILRGPLIAPGWTDSMSDIPACPLCAMENTYPDGDNYVCAD